MKWFLIRQRAGKTDPLPFTCGLCYKALSSSYGGVTVSTGWTFGNGACGGGYDHLNPVAIYINAKKSGNVIAFPSRTAAPMAMAA